MTCGVLAERGDDSDDGREPAVCEPTAKAESRADGKGDGNGPGPALRGDSRATDQGKGDGVSEDAGIDGALNAGL